MLDEKSIKERMQKSVDAVRRDLAKIRTGIAGSSPGTSSCPRKNAV